MGKALIAAGVAAVLIYSAGGARADWQYTTWGMAPEQVIRVAPQHAGLRQPTPDEARGQAIQGQPPGLVGYHYAGNFAFNASFYFAGGGLSRVYLTTKDYGNAQHLFAALKAQYGPPLIDRNIRQGESKMLWRDQAGRNEIEVYNMFQISTVGIHYTPTTPARGL